VFNEISIFSFLIFNIYIRHYSNIVLYYFGYVYEYSGIFVLHGHNSMKNEEAEVSVTSMRMAASIALIKKK
jgi:hypothetical protein